MSDESEQGQAEDMDLPIFQLGSDEWKEQRFEELEERQDRLEQNYAEQREELAETRENLSDEYEDGVQDLQSRIDRLQRELDRTDDPDVAETLSEQIEDLRDDRQQLQSDYDRNRNILNDRETIQRDRFEYEQQKITNTREATENFEIGALDTDIFDKGPIPVLGPDGLPTGDWIDFIEEEEQPEHTEESLSRRESNQEAVEALEEKYDAVFDEIRSDKIELSDKYQRDRREITNDIKRAEQRIERTDDPEERQQLQEYIETRKDDLQDRREDYNAARDELDERRDEAEQEYGAELTELYTVTIGSQLEGADIEGMDEPIPTEYDGNEADEIIESSMEASDPAGSAWSLVAFWDNTLEALAPSLTESDSAMELAALNRGIETDEAMSILADARNATDQPEQDDQAVESTVTLSTLTT